jgi:membrane protease YdiL (CAAX protease family)
VIPGACVLVVVLLVLPKRLVELRLVTYILLFVLFRDAMTPMGLWSVSENVVIRFPDSPSIHIMLGTLSGAFAYAITLLEPDWTAYLAWFRPGGKTTSIMFGALYSLLIVLPCWLYYSMSGAVAPNVVAGKSFFSLMSLMFLSYCGNLLEEVLFRGFLQGHLERSLILNHSDE